MPAITTRARLFHRLRRGAAALGMLGILGLGILAAWAMLRAMMTVVTAPASGRGWW